MNIIDIVKTERQAVDVLDTLIVGTMVVTEAARQLSLYFEREKLQAKAWIIEHRDEKAYNAYKMALSRWRSANLTTEEKEQATKGKGKGGGKKAGKVTDVTSEAVKIAEEEIRKTLPNFVKTLSLSELKELQAIISSEIKAREARQDKAGKAQVKGARL